MNTKVRTSLQVMKTASKPGISSQTEKEKGKTVTQSGGGRSMDGSRSRRERKIQLQKTVESLRKKLRREENIHRALERAFTRPLGSLPRLPPYLPSQMVELLAEVAVLEEEVITLEEQVINFRQALYEEAIYFSRHNKRTPKQPAKSPPPPPPKSPIPCPSAARIPPTPPHQKRKKKPTPPISRIRVKSDEEQTNNSPNKISEELLRCLIRIFFRGGVGLVASEDALEPSISGEDDGMIHDPYGIFTEFRLRDVGPYKRFTSLDVTSAATTSIVSPPPLLRKLRLLLRKLRSVDLRGLTHQEKLAFWVNVYNSCMMNAFLENGIPSTPQSVASLMQKAMINVGGQLMSAVSIEHSVLRLPLCRRSSIGGLDWPEPLVTFALSCGSWSSPALRVYTAAKVDEELETAKREYLQAAVGISTTVCGDSSGSGMGIPKLLEWYLLDFAKDVDSLLDWICLQLPRGLRNEAVNCLEARRTGQTPIEFIKIIPYDFSFRYLLAS